MKRNIKFIGFLIIALTTAFAYAQTAPQHLIRANEDVTWSYTTIILCASGWALHWLGGWGEQWKARRVSLIDNVLQNVPAFLTSIIATVSLYLIGPGIIAGLGVDLSVIPSQSAATLAKIGAFAAGYGADSIVAKLAALLPKRSP